MPSHVTAFADPQFILLAWAAGLAFASGFVASARIVGPGFTWMAAGVAALISLVGVLAQDGWWARVGVVLLAGGMVLARKGVLSGSLQLAAALGLLVQSATIGGPVLAVTATLALGGVTGEMMLGHWYLVDPRLPRWALKALAVAGIVGLAADAVVLAWAGLPGGGATVAYWVLTATSVVLMAGVLGALRYPAYSGVMAATGLSYLAVLTTLGATFLGRILVAGFGPIGT